jgi:hypothetical protein
MARYFFHLRDHADEYLDEDGLDMTGVDALQRAALIQARDVLSHDMRGGRIDLRYRIDVENDGGIVVYSLPFAGAFQVIGA